MMNQEKFVSMGEVWQKHRNLFRIADVDNVISDLRKHLELNQVQSSNLIEKSQKLDTIWNNGINMVPSNYADMPIPIKDVMKIEMERLKNYLPHM